MLDKKYRFLNHGNELIDSIQRKIGQQFLPTYNQTGVTFFGPKGRILKMVNNSRWIYFEFNVAVPPSEGLIIFSESEAREKHMGTCRWVYKGNSLDQVYKLVEEALENY
ncbi:hypothetical protein [Bacillus sinesaloumensis]|uniref:hypothetical protein n=1 Tax=Litchfieldia sinesaloumensis TaxID=1926280 RepID=UPI000988626F|nr:hypothetical protein [Bacillus sinesaloumensis]